MIRFYCCHCGQRISAEDEYVNQEGECPTCQGTFVVPGNVRQEERPETAPASGSEVWHSPPPPPPPPPSPPPAPRAHAAPPPPAMPARRERAGAHAWPPAPRPENYGWDDEPMEKPQGRAVWPWVVGTTALAGGLMVLFVMNEGPAAGSLNQVALGARAFGMLTGAMVPAAGVTLVIAGIAKACGANFARVWGMGYSAGVVLMTILGLTGMMAMGPAMQRRAGPSRSEIADMQESVRGMETDIRTVWERTTGPDGQRMPVRVDLTPTKAPTNDLEKIRQIQQSLMTEMAAVQSDYVNALDAAGLSRLLDASRVSEDTGFVESRRMLRELSSVVLAHRERAFSLMKNAPSRFKGVSFDYVSEAAAMKGFEEGMANVLPLLEENWNLELAVMNDFGALIDHLELTRRRWSVANGHFAFQLEGDLAGFNEIMDRMDAATARQEEIRKGAFNNALSKFEELKTQMPK